MNKGKVEGKAKQYWRACRSVFEYYVDGKLVMTGRPIDICDFTGRKIGGFGNISRKKTSVGAYVVCLGQVSNYDLEVRYDKNKGIKDIVKMLLRYGNTICNPKDIKAVEEYLNEIGEKATKRLSEFDNYYVLELER